MEQPAIFIAIANGALRQDLELLALSWGFQPLADKAHDQPILRVFQDYRPSILIMESPQTDEKDPLDVVRKIREIDQRFPIILLASHSSEALAVSAFRVGVKEYFAPPFRPEKIIDSVSRCLCERLQSNAVRGVPSRSLRPCYWVSERLIRKSPFMRKIQSFLEKAATVDSHVLITGETGTGKELAARYIHRQSDRRDKPMISINCAALPDSLLESELFGYEKGAFTGACDSYPGKLKLADGGTIFLDEIGDMSLYAQAKILRVIESKEIYPLGGKKNIPLDVRFIAATHRDLTNLASKNEFRQDLFYRLNVARIHLLPLRERKEDLPLLIDHYLQEFDSQFGREVKGFTEEALQFLMRHDWPGNVRELKNFLEALFIDPPQGQVTLADLPEWIRPGYDSADSVRSSEFELLLSTLVSAKGNKSKTARLLNWSRMTLYRKMVKYGIQ